MLCLSLDLFYKGGEPLLIKNEYFHLSKAFFPHKLVISTVEVEVEGGRSEGNALVFLV